MAKTNHPRQTRSAHYLEENSCRMVWYVLALAIILIAAGHAARYAAGNSTLAGSAAQHHLYLAEQAVSGSPSRDKTIDGNNEDKAAYLTPYHYLAGYLGLAADPEMIARFLAGIFGISAIMFFAAILNYAQRDMVRNMVTVAILVLSPAYVSMVLGAPEAMAVFCTLAGLFFLITPINKYGNGILSIFVRSIGIAVLLAASLFSIFNGILAIALAGIATKKWGLPKVWIGVLLVLVAGASLAAAPPWYPIIASQPSNPLITLIADVGGWVGFSVFFWILVVIGMIEAWREKQSYAPLYIAAVGVIAAALFLSQDINKYGVFLLSIFAAGGLLRIHHSHWNFRNLQAATLIIIVCGLLFSTVSYLNRYAGEPPSDDIREGMLVLRDTSGPGAMVLSHPSNGYVIEALASRTVLVDEQGTGIDDYGQKLKNVDILFQTRDLATAKQILGEYGIDYLVITTDMKKGKVWNTNRQGLLFLLRNNETFKNVYANEDVEIWKILSQNTHP